MIPILFFKRTASFKGFFAAPAVVFFQRIIFRRKFFVFVPRRKPKPHIVTPLMVLLVVQWDIRSSALQASMILSFYDIY